MSTKLTLTVKKSVIDKAKNYAKSEGRSLSNIVEEYLKSLTNQEEIAEDLEISPMVDSLWGSVKGLSDSKSYKELITEGLTKKYLK